MAKVPLKEQLMYLKGITDRFGMIHEAQIVQIRNYPRTIPNIKSAETLIDTEKHIITYNCESETPSFRRTKKVKIAIQNVTNWIRTVSWDDAVIEFNVNGKNIYDSRTD